VIPWIVETARSFAPAPGMNQAATKEELRDLMTFLLIEGPAKK
jgi:hypothetical protein